VALTARPRRTWFCPWCCSGLNAMSLTECALCGADRVRPSLKTLQADSAPIELVDGVVFHAGRLLRNYSAGALAVTYWTCRHKHRTHELAQACAEALLARLARFSSR
jgi:hypothetical protein